MRSLITLFLAIVAVAAYADEPKDVNRGKAEEARRAEEQRRNEQKRLEEARAKEKDRAQAEKAQTPAEKAQVQGARLQAAEMREGKQGDPNGRRPTDLPPPRSGGSTAARGKSK